MVTVHGKVLVRIVISYGGIMVMHFVVFAIIKRVMNETFYMGFK